MWLINLNVIAFMLFCITITTNAIELMSTNVLIGCGKSWELLLVRYSDRSEQLVVISRFKFIRIGLTISVVLLTGLIVDVGSTKSLLRTI